MSILNLREVQNHAPSIDECKELVIGRLRSLMRRLTDARHVGDELDILRAMIMSLPMASDDFCLAINRLRNAQRYLSSNETGAARYELRLLLGGL